MHYIVFILILLTTPAFAQLKVDDGLRSANSLVVGGNSVIDDASVDDDIEIPEDLSDEEKRLIEEGETNDTQAKILPTQPPKEYGVPEETGQDIKRVVRRQQIIDIPRSIKDNRIDDDYVQQLIRNHYIFTRTPE